MRESTLRSPLHHLRKDLDTVADPQLRAVSAAGLTASVSAIPTGSSIP